MTPDSPKRPDYNALHARIAEALAADPRLEGMFSDDVADYSGPANAVLAVVMPEVERLTAEVERLRSLYDLAERQYAAQNGELKTDRDRYKAAHESTQRALVRMEVQRDEARNERDEWKRAAEAETQGRQVEVSRLREQLAAQPKPIATEWGIRFAQGHVRSQSGEEPAREFVAHWKRGAEVVSRPVMDWEAANRGAAEVVVSSSEVEAPQPQPVVHYVTYEHENGEWQATCSGCLDQATGSLANIHFWKDQHEADTLRPKVDFGCVRVDLVSQWKKGDKALYKARPDDEGDECQLVAVAGDTAIVEADPFPFGNPQRWSADVSELHPLPAREPSCEEVVPEGPEDASLCGQDVVPGSDRCADHVGRPSGSGRLAPRPEGDFECCHRSAAQAARSEATPKVVACSACLTGDEHTPEDLAWRHDSPSPSLRKEGEDSD